MCTTADMDKIQEKVKEFVAKEKVFTAFDVTKSLRGITDFQERHRGVRKVISNLFKNTLDMAGYDKKLVSLNIKGRQEKAFVYHPVGIDASTHPLVEKRSGGSGGAGQVSKGIITEDVTITDAGRLQIPKTILAMIKGDSVKVDANGTVKVYSKNRDGRVRISKNHLIGDKAFGKTTYTVSIANQMVTIS
jgi:hypothetical protein